MHSKDRSHPTQKKLGCNNWNNLGTTLYACYNLVVRLCIGCEKTVEYLQVRHAQPCGEIVVYMHRFIRATGKHGNAGKHGNVGMKTGTGTETTKRSGEREPVSSPRVSDEPELAPHWVHSSIRKLIPRRHSHFVIVEPRVVVYRLSSSQVDGN